MSIADKILQLKNDFDSVYDKGYSDADYNLWKNLSSNGTRKSYAYTFFSSDFTGYTFPEPIIPSSTTQQNMFYDYRGSALPKNIDLSQIPTNAETHNFFCWATKLLEIPDMGLQPLDYYYQFFAHCYRVKKIELLRVKSSSTFQSTFYSDSLMALEYIRFEGEIGNSISFDKCPKLDTASIVDIFEHLSSTQGKTLTLNTTAKNNMVFPYTSPLTNITYNSWDELIATKNNWTISLI